MSFYRLNVLPGPICGHRSNNPHPKSDFLMPQNLVQQDTERLLRTRVTEAVHQYVEEFMRSGRDPLVALGQHRRTVHPVYGDDGGKQATSYGDEPGDANGDEEKDIFVRIPATTLTQPKTVRYCVVQDTDETREQGISFKGDASEQMRVKRSHTPSIPPYNGTHRSHSVTLGQQKHQRSKSAPLLDRRPKTPVPQLSHKMFIHPRMQSWMEGATDYEKEAVFKVFNTLNGKENPTQSTHLRTTHRPSKNQGSLAVKANRTPKATRVYVPSSPAPRKPIPERDGKVDATTKEWMRQVEQKINQEPEAQLDRKYTQKIQLPTNTCRQTRTKPVGNYKHESSMFRFSLPSYRRSFDICPDWVSETVTRRRQMKENRSANQLHYASV